MRLLYFVAKAEYFLSHRLDLARYAQTSNFDVAVSTTLFQKNDTAKINGIKNFAVRFKRGSLNPFREIQTLIDLFFVFKKFRPAIIHNVALKPSLYGALLARFYGIPSVNSINGFGYIFTSRHLKAKLLRPLVRCALRLILNHSTVAVMVQNQQDYMACKALLPKSDLYLVSGSGVDVKAFYPVKDKSAEFFTFTLVARMLWTKGIKEFVNAAEEFVRDNPAQKVRFLLVGSPDTENPESIQQDILRKWASEGVVEWLGHVDDVRSVYAQTHVAVLPSYREGMPKSLLEAMACGLPIITTDAIGCDEIVHSDNGIKVPIKSVEGLKKAFEKCVADKIACEVLGSRGRELAENLYCNDVINAKIVNIYNKILK